MTIIDQEQKVVLRDLDGNIAEITGGRLKSDTAVSLDTELATQIYGWDETNTLWRKISAAEYPTGSGQYWIGVFGEVGSRTKADNPINICKRKVIATSGVTIFVDETVPTDKVWYLLTCGIADSIAAEFNLWKGLERDKVELFDGTGGAVTCSLTHGAIDNSSYTKVEVYEEGEWVEYTAGHDFEIEDNPNDYLKSQIRWTKSQSYPDTGTDNIRVTYDASERKQGWFVRSRDSFQGKIDAPLKLTEGQFVIVTVKNKSNKASTVIANLTGFFEDE